ncbi:hypothetical protein QC762_403775 [Podospora pseudocomata]|uniref:Mid2 domain-containing protein n=1 Tax=Podospora pseudocomata TaxID=2093779 RepID=A0ABR0GFC8_9PEZI|nr:hypothetical protein QC762_403775 [Podospora pseudocomata]
MFPKKAMRVRLFKPIQQAVSLAFLVQHVVSAVEPLGVTWINPPFDDLTGIPQRFALGSKILIEWSVGMAYSDSLTIEIWHLRPGPWDSGSDLIGTLLKDIYYSSDLLVQEWWDIGDHDNINNSILFDSREFRLRLRRSDDPNWKSDSGMFYIQDNPHPDASSMTPTTSKIGTVTAPETLENEALDSSNELSQTAKTGIGVGVGFGSAVLIVLAILTTRLFMIRQNKTKQADISGEDVETHDVAKLTNIILVSLPTHELAANKAQPMSWSRTNITQHMSLLERNTRTWWLSCRLSQVLKRGKGNMRLNLPGQALRERIAVNGRPHSFCGANFTFKHCCQLENGARLGIDVMNMFSSLECKVTARERLAGSR